MIETLEANQAEQELQRLFGHAVDLVMTSALKNPFFVREVNRTRKPLYAA